MNNSTTKLAPVSDAEATQHKIHSFLQWHGVTEDPGSFIARLSNIYHGFESSFYDRHQISLQHSKDSWMKALTLINGTLNKPIRVLDYGAGTGFATLLALSSPLANKITEVVCYDLSPDMLQHCKENVRKFSNVSFTFLSMEDGEAQLLNEEPFDLVLTNSLIHHIFDLNSLFADLKRLVKPDGFYIAGHEPNRTFYHNHHLVRKTKIYQRYKKIKQKFLWWYWLHKLGIRKINPNLAALTNQELLRLRLIPKPIPEGLLHKMIDIHVPIGVTLKQPWGVPGFSAAFIQQSFLGQDFQICKSFTYSHIKDGSAASDWYWKKVEKQLSRQYPDDGADCLMVFQKDKFEE